MAKYTTEIRSICESLSKLEESVGGNSVENIIETARPKIFDFYYPIFDENYRQTLETKILKRFYTREIGAETFGLWKLWLNTRLNEIMPYFNHYYESALLKYDPLKDTDYRVEHTGDNAYNNKTGEGSDTHIDTDAWEYYSDTPQGGINGLADNAYLTNATHNTGESDTHTDTETNTTHTGNDHYIEIVTGKRNGVTYSKMVQELRETFINIDVMILDNLNDLFMNVW